MSRLTRGERFKDARVVHNQHKKQTMDEVFAATGVSKSLIQSLEDDSANRSVGYDKVAKLAEHYGVTTDYLLCLTDDPHRQPAATDDLGLSAKAVKKIRNLQRCSSNEREYMDFLNLVLGSDLFDHFLYALYVDVHVHLSELIYKSVATSSSDTQHAEIRRIVQSKKYNSLISSFLQQMVRFDREQASLENGDEDFQLDCSFSADDVVYLTQEKTTEAFHALLRDIYGVASRPIRKDLGKEAVSNPG